MQEKVDGTSEARSGVVERPRAFGKLWPFLRYAFIAFIIAELLLAFSTMHASIFLSNAIAGGDVTIEEGNFIDLHQVVFARLYLCATIVSVVAYCRFYYRAMKNLTVVRAAGIETSPFWAVGYFFVPFANLWMPFDAVRQIWRGSFDPKSAATSVPGIIGWWWFFWLSSNFLGNVSFQMELGAGAWGEGISNFELYVSALNVNIISSPLSIISTLIVLNFSKKIKQAQDEKILKHYFPSEEAEF